MSDGDGGRLDTGVAKGSLSKELAVVRMSDELKIRRWRTPAGARGLFTARHTALQIIAYNSKTKKKMLPSTSLLLLSSNEHELY
jgi:hypothetical protein